MRDTIGSMNGGWALLLKSWLTIIPAALLAAHFALLGWILVSISTLQTNYAVTQEQLRTINQRLVVLESSSMRDV